jgi:hypothetical protein
MTVGKSWLVLDMDDGLLRREPSRTAAVQWYKGLTGSKVIARHSYGPGAYEYICGFGSEDRDSGKFIEREDVAASRGGWDLSRSPLYPYEDRPYERVERQEAGHAPPGP